MAATTSSTRPSVLRCIHRLAIASLDRIGKSAPVPPAAYICALVYLAIHDKVIHKHTHTHPRPRPRPRACAHAHAQTHTQTHTQTDTDTDSDRDRDRHRDTHTHRNTHTHTNTTHTHTETHTHAHTHTETDRQTDRHGESVRCTLGRISCSRYSCWLCMAVAKCLSVRRRSPSPRSAGTATPDRCNKGGESRYVCTGFLGRSSLTTAPRRPRWCPAKNVGERMGCELLIS